jgi:hypothetical protein
MVVHTRNPSTREAEAGDCRFEANLSSWGRRGVAEDIA